MDLLTVTMSTTSGYMSPEAEEPVRSQPSGHPAMSESSCQSFSCLLPSMTYESFLTFPYTIR